MRFEDTTMTVKKKNKFQFSNFGFASILLTFVMMCIMTFGVLSLITANSDLKLSKKVAEKSKGYAIAKEEAYEKMSELDDILLDIYSAKPSFENFFNLVQIELNGSKLSEYVIESTDSYIRLHWESEITDTQYLSVTIRINSPADNAGYYTVEDFYTAHIENESEIIDDSLHVIGND